MTPDLIDLDLIDIDQSDLSDFDQLDSAAMNADFAALSEELANHPDLIRLMNGGG
jgi:hypothetical protein